LAKIVIAEDNKWLALGLERFFIKRGYEVEIAFNGKKLISLLKKNHADLVITDLRLPGVDGMSALKKIKEISPNLPSIVMTGFGDSDVLSEATKLGVSDFLTKPFTLSEIESSVQKALKG
jgi:DNA-binding NtrC family response regulator